jgi:hypothetical protein
MTKQFNISYTIFHTLNRCKYEDIGILKNYVNELNFKASVFDYITLDIKVNNPSSKYLIQPELKLNNIRDIRQFLNNIKDIDDVGKIS